MPKLKSLSADEIASVLRNFGFQKISQNGSHMKFARITMIRKEVLIVPNHNPVSKGTIKSIFNQASRFISSEELEKHFYTK